MVLMFQEDPYPDLSEQLKNFWTVKSFGVTEEEEERTGPRTWYLPHFAVRNPNKPTKMRLVWDAAAKSHGVCLNDRLLKGPDLNNTLVGVLFIFRERPIAICGDLKEMFHQVRIREADQDSQRFLGRNQQTRKLITLQMQVMIFGAISSPYVAQEIKNRNADEFKNEYPEACQAIISKHYMDDYLDSVDGIDEAIRRAQEVALVHSKGGFEIRNWMSNSPEVLRALPAEAVAQRGMELAFNEEEFQRVLGVVWSPENDIFTFSTAFPRVDQRLVTGEKHPSKREVLKLIMSVFDPLGLLAVMTIRGKILMQDLWRAGVSWDSAIPENLKAKWETWLADLKMATEIRIPRCYTLGIGKIRNVELHIFCDASEQAFAAAGYLRLEGESGRRTVLVMAKSKVAPVKQLTIPKLELQAAVMGSRLAQTIIDLHTLKICKRVFWTDSQTVVKWIRSEARKHPPFVINRISEILDTTAVEEWRWVPTKQNVADDATRDTNHIEITSSSRWYNGPEFLALDEDDWPKEKLSAESEVSLIMMDRQKLIDFFRFSSWTRLIRTMARVCRFADKCRRRGEPGELTALEISRGEIEVLKTSQAESFWADINILQRGGELKRSCSKIFNLSPMLTKDGLIRMEGRIKNPEVSAAVREPIILDGKHRAVRLLIQFHHEKAGHVGRERVVNDLRMQYWIIKLRPAVKSVIKDCQFCKIRKAKPSAPKMAPLPDVRTESFVRPFTNTGVDYFGPLYVTIGRRREKRYGVLFTCLNVRAVHLEIAASLTTDSMIMALRRMMARRGKPKRIYSDNGTNFIGAKRELREALEELDQDVIQKTLSTDGIEWHFIPPGSPHMGGCWERLVGSVKRALEATMNEQAPREEILQTLFAEAEYSINCRPLTYASDNPEDPESLTPNHFLLLWNAEGHGPPGRFSNDDFLRRSQWRKSQAMAEQFWRRWVREYLPTLNIRTKWFTNGRDLQVGDVIVIWDDQLPRNQWIRGRISAVYPGADGRVRVADVKTATGTYRRPVHKLCILECHARIPK